ncbi:unnamed protein product [Arctogadus glacialis]
MSKDILHRLHSEKLSGRQLEKRSQKVDEISQAHPNNSPAWHIHDQGGAAREPDCEEEVSAQAVPLLEQRWGRPDSAAATSHPTHQLLLLLPQQYPDSLENTLITSPHSRLGTLISPLAAHIDWAACLSLTHKLSVSVYPLICGADKLHLCILLFLYIVA